MKTTILVSACAVIGLISSACSVQGDGGAGVSVPTAPAAPVTLANGVQVASGTLNAAFNEAMQQSGVTGAAIAIINEGAIVYSYASGQASIATGAPVTPETTFEAASLSKPLFGAFVVYLAGEGVMDIDTPLTTYFPHPDLDDPRAGLLTARMVLSHQTGLPNWRSHMADGQLAFQFDPGAGFSYSGEAYEYLADVLMEVLQTDDTGLDAVYRAWLTEPNGIDATSFVQAPETLARKSEGYQHGQRVGGDADYTVAEFGAAHSVHADAISYAQAMIALMDGSALGAEGQQAFYTPQNTPIPVDDPQRALGLTDWALGFSVYEMPLGRFYGHGGNNRGYTNVVTLNPETGWGLVMLSNEDQAAVFTQAVIAIASGMGGAAG